MTEPTVPPRGPMPLTVILDEAMRRTRAHFRAIFPAVGLPVAVLSTIVAVVQAFSFQDLLGNGRIEQLSPFAMWSPLVIVTALLLALLGALAYVAGQVAALDALAGRPVDMKRAWRFAARASRLYGRCCCGSWPSSSPPCSASCRCSTSAPSSPSSCR